MTVSTRMIPRGVVGFICGALAAATLIYSGALPSREATGPEAGEASEAIAKRPVEASPHIVLVVVCTLRRDQVSVYGGPADLTPTLAEWAREGAVFEHAYSAAPWTKAASTAIMTGHHAIQVGMIEPESGANRRRLSDEVTTLAEVFQGAGYFTLGLTANPNTNREFGFDQGFDTYVQATDQWREGMVKVSGPRMAELALDALDAREDQDTPVYLRMMILDPHAPLSVGMKEARRWKVDGEEVPARMLKYRHLVHRADRAIAVLEKGLEARGMDRSNTVFMVVSDHGEGLRMPVHHGMGHGNLTFSTTVSMPWIAVGAGVAKGHRVGGAASQVDVMPTLLGLAGLQAPDVQGLDWSSQLIGKEQDTTRDVAFVDTWFQQANRWAGYTAERSCHYDGRPDEALPAQGRRLPQTSCYDQRSDPYQESPLATLDEGLLEQMHGWREARMEEYRAFTSKEDVEVDVDLMEQLSALGYVDEAAP